MKIATLAFVSSLICQCAFSYYIPSIQDAAAEIEKRQSVVVTKGASGTKIYPRYEVRQMLKQHPSQWTLFILAMQAFQAQSQSSATSYYQIAGIHGVPLVDYNGVSQCSSCSSAYGYCTHNSVLFPAWHRTYMALFEQQFLTVVNQIADSFTGSQKQTMQQAASTMRFPYWDWAASPGPGMHNLPNVVSEKYITVEGPSGSETIINPLFRHDFSDPSGLYYSPFNTWDVTLRYPNSDAAAASSQENQCITAFDNIRASLQDQVYQLFTTCSDYLHFSNDDAGSSSTSCSNSLEGIHNTVHTTAGGPGNSTVEGGHMTYLPLAAFDPIFWLHHCNVDRLFAMWQSQYPNSYGASQVAPGDTWTIAAGSTQNANSPLTPFYKDTDGNFWTTNLVRNWNTTFHYTYPEFYDSNGSKEAIASYINKLYGPSATATAGSSKRSADPEPVAAAEAATTAAPELVVRQGSPLVAENGSLFQYVANIKTSRYALNGSYTIYLFNGSPESENPYTWITDKNLIGPMGVPAQSNMGGNNLVATGSIPLTRTLTEVVGSGLLASLAEILVVPFLATNLQWRIMGPDGREVDPTTIPNFEVAVFASTATQPSSDYELPEWSDFIPLLDVTHQKAGGANSTADATSL